MTVRNLDALFAPESVAVIGASERAGSLGRILTENLLSEFAGPVLPVNPKYGRLFDVDVFPDVERLPITPDLAVIVTPPATIPGLIQSLAKRGTRGACVISAGADLKQAMLDAAKPGLVRIVGPNCLGLQVPRRGLNASFAQTFPRTGGVSFVAQSGAMITSVLDWAEPRGIGFSHTVSLGDMADVDFGDMLDYLAQDRQSTAILLYIEAITNPRKFMSAARAAARIKPVIAVKAGRHEAAARAAASHTGALAGHDAVYDAAFRRAGILRVSTMEDLFDAVETLAAATLPRDNALTILTNGGGIGVLATDALIEAGGELAVLSASTVEKLNGVLPPTWSHANPIDIIGDATGKRYADALGVLLEDDETSAVLVLNCPTGVASSDDAAVSVLDTVTDPPAKTILTSWVGETSAQRPRERFRSRGIPSYSTPEDAVRAFSHIVAYERNRGTLMETPPSIPELFEPDTTTARSVLETAIESQQSWLSEIDSKRILEAYGIPTVHTVHAASPEEAGALAARFDGHVAVKILSPEMTHKSDVGGVALDVDPARAEEVASRMLSRIRESFPDTRIDGFTVQTMVHRPQARELIAGMVHDRQFGPVLLFGQGGTAVEVVSDEALALPPLNLKLARELIARTNVYRLLKGYRDVKPANLYEIELTLVRLSQLVADCAEIVELDINPLLADPDGVIALDARVRVAPAETKGPERLAIRPYPKELEENLESSDGARYRMRPIVPEDEPALQRAFAKLTVETIRAPFFLPAEELDHASAARFTQIDYDRQMALVLTEPGIAGRATIYGVVRLIEDPDRAHAELTIVLAREVEGRGLGARVMTRMLDYARQRGIGDVYCDIPPNDSRTQSLYRTLGFTISEGSGSEARTRASLQLS